MKVKYLYCIIAACLFFECSSSTKSIRSENYYKTIMDSNQFSVNFKSLWKEVIEECGNNDLHKYTPSQNLINKFSLRKQNNQYILSGFLHTDSTFKESDIENHGGNVVKYSDKIKTFTIPIKNIPALIKVKGITYIDTGRKVQIK